MRRLALLLGLGSSAAIGLRKEHALLVDYEVLPALDVTPPQLATNTTQLNVGTPGSGRHEGLATNTTQLNVGTPGSGRHEGRTNPDAVQDAWPDCTVPDGDGNYFTQCAPEPGYFTKPDSAIRMAFVGDSATSGVGVGSKSETWPSLLQAQLGDGYSVTNLGAGAATALSPANGGPTDISYWVRPQFRALMANTWDTVVIQLGGNDAKLSFWPASCADDATMLTCPLAMDLKKLIALSKARGRREGEEARVLLSQNPNPYCCKEGARTCADTATDIGCGYCLACQGSYTEQLSDGTYTKGVDSHVRMELLPKLIAAVGREAGVPVLDFARSATPEVPPTSCEAGIMESFLPMLRQHSIEHHNLGETCPGHHLPVPDACQGPCCSCHPPKGGYARIAQEAHRDIARLGIAPTQRELL